MVEEQAGMPDLRLMCWTAMRRLSWPRCRGCQIITGLTCPQGALPP